MKKARGGKTKPANPVRDVDVAGLGGVQGGLARPPGTEGQHNETFVRRGRAKRAR